MSGVGGDVNRLTVLDPTTSSQFHVPSSVAPFSHQLKHDFLNVSDSSFGLQINDEDMGMLWMMPVSHIHSWDQAMAAERLVPA